MSANKKEIKAIYSDGWNSGCSEEVILLSHFNSIDELKHTIREKISDRKNYPRSLCRISNRGAHIALSFK